MTTDNAQHSVLVLGRSQVVLDDIIVGLRGRGYSAHATNEFFSDITGRFDPNQIDMVVLGGGVPPDRKTELTEEMSAVNPRITFVQGLAGIPGLIVNQIQGAFAVEHQDPAHSPTFTPDERTIRLSLAGPSEVKVTLWWMTSFVPPDPKSDSVVLLDRRVAAGAHEITVPDHIPPQNAFATVQVGAAIYAFSIATEQVEHRPGTSQRSRAV